MISIKEIIVLCIISIFLGVLSASDVNAATLNWHPSSGNPDGYKIYYGTATNPLANSKDVGNVTRYNIDNLPLSENVQYSLSVSAYNTIGESSPCPPVVYKPGDTTPPSPPIGLTAP